MITRTTLAVLASTVVSTGCIHHAGDGSADSAASALDSSDSTESEANVMMSVVDGADATGLVAATPEQIAIRIAANVAGRWNPTGCATVVQNATQITVTYKDCTGPRGLVHVSGTLSLTVTGATTGAITVHGTSSDLKVNRADLMVDVTASYAIVGTGHTLTVTTSGTGTGPRGNVVDHDGNYTLTWDTTTMCHSVVGHWQTDLGARERSNDVTLQRCAAGCPTGNITHHYLGGASLTVTFDGTNTARWSTSTGLSGTTALGCQ